MKLCLDCCHCRVNPGSPAYSDQTPGENTVLRCEFGYWDMADIVESDDAARLGLRSCLLKAETCHLYEQVRTPPPGVEG